VRRVKKRLARMRKISIRRDVANAILDYNSEKPDIADSVREFLTKCGRLGMDVFDVDKRLRGEAPTRMEKGGHATVDVPEEDFMKVYRFVRRVGLFSSVADFYETAAMNVILGIWELRGARSSMSIDRQKPRTR